MRLVRAIDGYRSQTIRGCGAMQGHRLVIAIQNGMGQAWIPPPSFICSTHLQGPSDLKCDAYVSNDSRRL